MENGDPSNHLRLRPSSQRWGTWVLLVLIAVGMGIAGYFALFSSFATYDDEGYVMISLRSYIEGAPLYDETFSQYGPAYFQFNDLVHRGLGLPVTHDAVRWKTLFTWLLSSFFVAAWCWNMTRRWWIVFLSAPIAFFHLDRFGLEPAHPQEWCILLTVMVVWLVTLPEKIQRASRTWIVVGCLVALVALTKLNLGIFLALAIMLSLLAVQPKNRLNQFLLLGLSAAAVVMPLVLMRDHLHTVPGATLPILIAGSLLILLAVLARARIQFRRSNRRPLLMLIVGLVATGCVSLLLAWHHGTTWNGLLHGLVLQHLDLKVYKFLPLYSFTLPWLLVSAGLAYAVIFRKNRLVMKWIDLGVIVFATCLLLRQLTESFSLVTHGGSDRSLAVLLTSVVTPMTWIVLLPILRPENPSSSNPVSSDGWWRVMLCLFAVIQPLQAFPIPGTQVALGSLFLAMILLVAMNDAIQRNLAIPDWSNRQWRNFHRAAVGLVIVLVVLRVGFSFHHHQSCVRLDLPGAQRLRLPSTEVEQIRWVVRNVRSQGSTFIGAPNGYPSYYFWTRLDPPTHLNATFWPTLLTESQQREVIQELAKHRASCIIVHREAGQWQSIRTPLIDYLKTNYHCGLSRNQHEIWVPVTKPDIPAVASN